MSAVEIVACQVRNGQVEAGGQQVTRGAVERGGGLVQLYRPGGLSHSPGGQPGATDGEQGGPGVGDLLGLGERKHPADLVDAHPVAGCFRGAQGRQGGCTVAEGRGRPRLQGGQPHRKGAGGDVPATISGQLGVPLTNVSPAANQADLS